MPEWKKNQFEIYYISSRNWYIIQYSKPFKTSSISLCRLYFHPSQLICLCSVIFGWSSVHSVWFSCILLLMGMFDCKLAICWNMGVLIYMSVNLYQARLNFFYHFDEFIAIKNHNWSFVISILIPESSPSIRWNHNLTWKFATIADRGHHIHSDSSPLSVSKT